MSELYRLENLSRVFGPREVLSIPHLSIEAGLIYGLLGPNGSGKTTLMKLLAFLDAPSSGRIIFQGQEAEVRHMAEFRSKVVWSPQFPVMFTGSLRYNVEYPMKIKGVPSTERRRRALELLEMVRLAELAEAPARRLSGGEAQRASLARALAAGAEVLMLDEPTANVDVKSRADLVNLVENIWREQKLSIVITTHDQSLESELCQRHIRLRDGRLLSLDETTVHQAELIEIEGRTVLKLPPEAGRWAGPLEIDSLSLLSEAIQIKLSGSVDQPSLSVRITDKAGRELARLLTLGDRLDLG